MTEQEGVIKFQLDFSPASALPADDLLEISAWRKMLYLTQLIGQTPDRYEGYGFGNISRRLAPLGTPENEGAPQNERRFVISGTQTGSVTELLSEHYAVVQAYYPARNLIVGEGPVRPSSESLTHGMVYDMDETAQWVMHAHSPHIWRHARALGIPMTDGSVAYGSPEMAGEVQRLFRETDVADQKIFGMDGHEDGIVTFGATAEEAGFVLLNSLARAFQQN
jgi:L-ribulose-5-phosphate 4-epimerase